MELFIISGYAALCIALFAGLRIPLNRWTVPTASIGGVIMTFALIQLLNFYHPYSGNSQQNLTFGPVTTDDRGQPVEFSVTIKNGEIVAWFPENNLLHLEQGNEIEVTFASVPGRVFTGLVKKVLPINVDPDQAIDVEQHSGIPVLIEITDKNYAWYASRLPGNSHAQVAVYGREFQELALVRKTLLHMSAWMNYLTPLS